MKTKLPTKWTKKFAWLPVCATHGAADAGKRIWLEFMYYRFGIGMEYLSKSDYDYNKQLFVTIKRNPERFGDDPYREEL